VAFESGDDKAVTVKDGTATAQADDAGVADFARLKFTKGTKEASYRLRLERVMPDSAEGPWTGLSDPFKINGLP
jgi:hypothetical protein